MGNRLSLVEEHEVDEVAAELSYFKDIKTDRVQYFYEQIASQRLSDFGLEHQLDSLCWSDYFKHMVEIAEHGAMYGEAEARRAYHPATLGLLLTPIERAPLPTTPKKGIPDDFTEDEPSDDDSDEDSSDEESEAAGGNGKGNSGKGSGSGKASKPVSSSAPAPPPAPAARLTPNWDPAITSPIFFGVATSSYPAHAARIAEQKEEDMAEERRIVEKTFQIRKVALEDFEKSHFAREAARQSKIEALVAAYALADEGRERERERSENTLPPAGLRRYVCMYICMYVYICTYICMYILYIHIYVCIYILYIHMCICMYIFIILLI
jgi:hypothetical protein